MIPKYEVFEGRQRLFRRAWYFQLIAGNGEPLGTSEPYTTQAHAINGVYDYVYAVFTSCGFDPWTLKPQPTIVFRERTLP